MNVLCPILGKTVTARYLTFFLVKAETKPAKT